MCQECGAKLFALVEKDPRHAASMRRSDAKDIAVDIVVKIALGLMHELKEDREPKVAPV